MPTYAVVRRPALALIAGVISAFALAAPAYAEGGVPGEPLPAPGIEAGGGMTSSAGNGCQGGEVRVDGNCVPGVTTGELPMRDDQSSTTGSFVNPVETVPNINGTPCEGAWVSTVCLEEADGGSPRAVEPRSTLSSSP